MWTFCSATLMYIEKKKKSRKLPTLCSLPGLTLASSLSTAQLLPPSLRGMQERMGTAKGWDKGTVSGVRRVEGTNSAKAIATSQKQTSAQPPLQFSWWTWNRVSLGQFWPAVPTVSSPSFLLIPGLVTGAGRVGERWNLDAVQGMLSKSQSTGVLPALFFPQIQSRAAP